MAKVTAHDRQQRDDTFEREKDSLYVLPLSTIPLENKGLQRARLVKNVQLRGVVELFSDQGTGSGQIEVADLGKVFDWPKDAEQQDLARLLELSRLPSYDVYSLRILLRDLDIEVNNVDDLRLSPGKNQELTAYMRTFTGPLIRQVYGAADVSVKDFGDIINLFRQADAEFARHKLERLARMLGISLFEVPKFLEDFGDIFLSLSYYKSHLDDIQPKVDAFLVNLNDFRTSREMSQNRLLMTTCDDLEARLNGLNSEITNRFEGFFHSAEDMWTDISAARFRRVEALITGYHTAVGGVLCALGSKMNAWEERFPRSDGGGLWKRAEFITTHMRQGLEYMEMFQDNAPPLTQFG